MQHYVVKTLRGETKYTKSPDGKWGWVVVLSGFFIFGISYSIAKNLGYFYLYFQNEFETSNYQTSWIMSITFSMFGMGAPFCTPLQHRYGARKIIMLGGLLSLCGLAISSLSKSIYILYLGIGVISGIAFSWANVSVISQVSLYFDKYVAVATGITASGSAVCSTILPFLSKYLLEKYGWRGSLLIYAGLGFNVTMFGALVRPISVVSLSNNETTDKICDQNQIQFQSQTRIEVVKKFCKKYWVVFLLAIAEVIEGLAIYVPYVYIVPYAKELGMSDLQAAHLLSMSSIVDIIGRPLGGLIISLSNPVRNNILLYIFTSFISLSLIQFLPLFFTSYSVLLPYAILYGGIFGLMVAGALSSVRILMGTKQLQTFFGLKFFSNGLSTLIGPPIAGHLVDTSHSYRVVFWYCGICLLFAALVNLVCHIIVKCRGGVILEEENMRED